MIEWYEPCLKQMQTQEVRKLSNDIIFCWYNDDVPTP